MITGFYGNIATGLTILIPFGMILSFYGRKGSFKTTFMTAFAELAYKHGVPIFSNFPLTFMPEENRIEITEVLKFPPKIMGSMVLWDEAYMNAHARRHMSQLNIDVGNFGFQNRKMKLDLLCSYIKFTSFESSMREASDLTIVCEAVPPFGRPYLAVFRFCLPPAVVMHNITGLDEYEVIRTIMTYADDWRPVWRFFDTYWKQMPEDVEREQIVYQELTRARRKKTREIAKRKVKGELGPPA